MQIRFTNAFLCLSNHSQPPRDLIKGATVHDQTCPWVHWCRHRTFWAFVVNCDLINNNNSTVIKLWNVLSVFNKILNVLRYLLFNATFQLHSKTTQFRIYVYMNIFLKIVPTRCTNISNFIFGMKVYTFRAVPLSIIRSSSLYTQQWYTWCVTKVTRLVLYIFLFNIYL